MMTGRPVTVRNHAGTVAVVAVTIEVTEASEILMVEMVVLLKFLSGMPASWVPSTKISMFLNKVSLIGMTYL